MKRPKSGRCSGTPKPDPKPAAIQLALLPITDGPAPTPKAVKTYRQERAASRARTAAKLCEAKATYDQWLTGRSSEARRREVKSGRRGGVARAKQTQAAARAKPTYRSCTIDGCERSLFARGLCTSHYHAQRRADRRAAQP